MCYIFCPHASCIPSGLLLYSFLVWIPARPKVTIRLPWGNCNCVLLGESRTKLLAISSRFGDEIGCGGGQSLIDKPKYIQPGRCKGDGYAFGHMHTHHVRCQAVSPDPRDLQAFSGFGFILCSPVPPEKHRDNVWQGAGNPSPRLPTCGYLLTGTMSHTVSPHKLHYLILKG